MPENLAMFGENMKVLKLSDSVDYIFFVKKNFPKETNFNPDEIDSIEWVGRNFIYDFVSEKEKIDVISVLTKEKITPWFNKILDHELIDWWRKLEKNQHQDKTGHLHRKVVDLMDNSYN